VSKGSNLQRPQAVQTHTQGLTKQYQTSPSYFSMVSRQAKPIKKEAEACVCAQAVQERAFCIVCHMPQVSHQGITQT